MRIQELFNGNENVDVPKIFVYLDGEEREELEEVAGMLHDLMCSIEGRGEFGGFSTQIAAGGSPIVFPFSTFENASYFKSCAEYYFDGDLMVGLALKNRVCCTTH